jgi:hypothetical protein
LFGHAFPQTIVCVGLHPERDNIVGRNKPKLVWVRSSTKHRISRERSRYVVEQAQMRFIVEDPVRGRRLIYVGDDQAGVALEVVAIELDDDELAIIHAMKLRKKFIGMYWEARHGI